jgi:hypothetical protein
MRKIHKAAMLYVPDDTGGKTSGWRFSGFPGSILG